MESKLAKVLDNGRRVVVNLKSKQADRCNTYIAGAKLSEKRTASNSPINKVVKRIKLDTSASQFKSSLLKNYSNFTKSGVPQRVMFYQNGEWNDFPHDVITPIRKDLLVKKAAIEVEYNGNGFVLDFLHMVRLDLKTGSTLPMAWIDESGKCFFPETFSGDDEFYNFEEDEDIKLNLEIEVKEPDCLKLKECSGDSDDVIKQVPVGEKFARGHCNLEGEGSCAKASKIGESKQIENNGNLGIERGDMDLDDVRNLFVTGIGSSLNSEIVELYRGLSASMEARLELFYKQVEITSKYRGDANVRYAWFPTTKEALSNIMMYGLGHIETSPVNSTYGIGVHLSPANCTFNRISSCDVDENGVRHIVFCRVIMGNMELVQEGSKQFHPSSEDFDSGVNDIQNPSCYVVWNMNKNTHIYPEFVVSFKVPSDTAGFEANSVGKLDISGVTACYPEPPIVSPYDKSPAQLTQNKAPSLDSSTTRVPKSPWVNFPTLLAAVSDKIPPGYMKLLEREYENFRSKKINRQDFIRKLRLAVGDNILRSIILYFHSKRQDGNMDVKVEPDAGKVVVPKSESKPFP